RLRSSPLAFHALAIDFVDGCGRWPREPADAVVEAETLLPPCFFHSSPHRERIPQSGYSAMAYTLQAESGAGDGTVDHHHRPVMDRFPVHRRHEKARFAADVPDPALDAPFAVEAGVLIIAMMSDPK